ncbi:peptidylprolyl isomerase [Streptomyces sp. NPDC053427]|uniref:peptidylprolyl isomerase n=1 Tax=Streptomyces sp. NPDC053427 TaxID=3365701 RepID=UPI0037D20FA2
MTKVKLATDHGDIILRLDAEKAPRTVENFVRYVEDGYYDGTVFHRVIKNLVLQGGGFEPGMNIKTTRDAIVNEANNGLGNNAYTVAMARMTEPHSAASQFFINVNDNDSFNHTDQTEQGWGYAVFGEVIEGREVVDAIENVRTVTKAGYADVPEVDVVLERAEIVG